MPRARCQQCHRLLSQCLCALARPYPNQHGLIILQHPSEQYHPKGTAPLISLTAQHTKIIVGESASDFIHLQQQVAADPSAFALLYPNATSQVLASESAQRFKQLILLDATWRKAYKMWQLNPWLAQLNHFHLPEDITGDYPIRKSPTAQHLSTLEASAHALLILEDAPIQNALHLQQAMMEQQFSHMSPQVKQRYQS